MNRNEQRKYGSILGYIYMALHAVVSIIYIPILLRYIGKSEYGLYQILGSIIAYCSIMETPLSSAILRYYSYYKERKNSVSMENVLAIGQRIIRSICLIIVILIGPCLLLMKVIYSGTLSSNELIESYYMLIVMVLNVVIVSDNIIYVAAINANEDFVFLKLTNIVVTMMQPLLVVIAIKKYPYAITIVTMQCLLNILLTIVRRLYAKQKLDVIVKLHNRDRQLTKQIISLSLSVFFVAFADQIFWRADQLILGAMGNTNMVAEYSIGSQINTIYISIGCVLAGVILPLATRIDIDDDANSSKLSELFAKIGRYQTYILMLVLTGFILYGKECINIIAGPGFEQSYYVALLLMIPYTVDLIQNVGCTILQIKNKFHLRAIVTFINAIVNIFLTIIFVHYLGMIGAALATMVTIIIGNWIAMNIIYVKVLKLSVNNFFKSTVPIISVSMFCMIIGVFISKLEVYNLFSSFVMHVFTYTIVYIMLMYFLVFNKHEKQIVINVCNAIKAVVKSK